MRQGRVWTRSRCNANRLLTRWVHRQIAARLRSVAWKSSAHHPLTIHPRLHIIHPRCLLCKVSLSNNHRRGNPLRQGCLPRRKRNIALRHHRSLNRRRCTNLQRGRWTWTKTMTTAEMMTKDLQSRKAAATAQDRLMAARHLLTVLLSNKLSRH